MSRPTQRHQFSIRWLLAVTAAVALLLTLFPQVPAFAEVAFVFAGFAAVAVLCAWLLTRARSLTLTLAILMLFPVAIMGWLGIALTIVRAVIAR